ncbi:zinc-binding dehydrogenase [Cognatishimia sp. SS12]|uniref:zinc-binding dehydrogenase n=1 Tax=Cognatishimia sp. SS12 TaxID=2979465 RepID=UPI00232A843A|nr:zinc-binding dehydrogenase [Cognatishimia sp. SS12]MDC0739380.1 zinc-binding dehydrogenase [Cognatishimia sp. SS12]
MDQVRPTQTQAAVLTEFGAPLQVQTLPLPDTLEPGAVIVQIVCATLCGTDIEIWSGKMRMPDMLPQVLGHEMVGEVVATGADAADVYGTPLSVGDRIGWSESTCGQCAGCVSYREPVLCEDRGYSFKQRADRPPYAAAGISQYCYVKPASAKLRIPAAVKSTWASMACCAGKTVLRAFDRVGGLCTGATVVVQGAGALGIFATAVAKISGAGRVITIGAPEERLAMARRFGADETIDISGGSDGAAEQVLHMTQGRGADYVFDFAGAKTIGREAVQMAAKRGKIMVVGATGPADYPVPLGGIMRKELTVLGSLNGDIADYENAINFFEKYAEAAPWDSLFEAPVGLSGAAESVLAMAEHRAIKAVIDPRLP